jgi:hypothetical protein
MSTFRVAADIEYLDGSLSGLVLVDGFHATFPDRESANRCSQWLCKVAAENDFVRAAVTGNRFKVIGHITNLEMRPCVLGA